MVRSCRGCWKRSLAHAIPQNSQVLALRAGAGWDRTESGTGTAARGTSSTFHGVFLPSPLYLAGKPLPGSAHLHPGSLPRSHEAAMKHPSCFLLLLLRKSPSLTSLELRIHPPTSGSPKRSWEVVETSGVVHSPKEMCLHLDAQTPQGATRATTLTGTQTATQQSKSPVRVCVGHGHPHGPHAWCGRPISRAGR